MTPEWRFGDPLPTGQVQCPKKGTIALQRCVEYQAQSKAETGRSCKCSVYTTAVGETAPSAPVRGQRRAPSSPPAPKKPAALRVVPSALPAPQVADSAASIETEKSATALAPAPEGVNIEVVEVTPELATKWLEANKDNRPLSQAWISAIERDIRAGAWRENGEAIKFYADGSLDGQHRLWAIIEAGIAVRSLVVRGLPPEVRTTDRHRPRRDADDLRGFTDPKRVVAMAKAIDLLHNGKARTLTFHEVEGIVEQHRAGLEWASVATSAKFVRYAPVAGALAFAFKYESKKISDFTARLSTGANHREGSPALALRNFIGDVDKVRAAGRREVMLRVLHAALKHVRHEPLERTQASEEAVDYFSMSDEPEASEKA